MNWMYRCANDLWGYCTGEPEWEKEPEVASVKNFDNQVVEVPLKTPCIKDKAKCKRYRTFSQIIGEQMEVTNARFANTAGL